MRKYKNELDVDFIGGQKPLTKEEEGTISAFIQAGKQRRGQLRKVKTSTVKQKAHSSSVFN